jgi:hypothetical protein
MQMISDSGAGKISYLLTILIFQTKTINKKEQGM